MAVFRPRDPSLRVRGTLGGLLFRAPLSMGFLSLRRSRTTALSPLQVQTVEQRRAVFARWGQISSSQRASWEALDAVAAGASTRAREQRQSGYTRFLSCNLALSAFAQPLRDEADPQAPLAHDPPLLDVVIDNPDRVAELRTFQPAVGVTGPGWLDLVSLSRGYAPTARGRAPSLRRWYAYNPVIGQPGFNAPAFLAAPPVPIAPGQWFWLQTQRVGPGGHTSHQARWWVQSAPPGYRLAMRLTASVFGWSRAFNMLVGDTVWRTGYDFFGDPLTFDVNLAALSPRTVESLSQELLLADIYENTFPRSGMANADPLTIQAVPRIPVNLWVRPTLVWAIAP